ncbi:putative nuclease HARBI1 [Nephila pilipes]|uniref:Putative nuclease HARBI1 n=1 Tax=Nephila pilipes TaxID=299642 RepID=A0A8X6PU52_NEPPI|nr:putative nuclease HARBI1 [Nephila pilipes]
MTSYVVIKKHLEKVRRNRIKQKIYRFPSTSAFSIEDTEFKKLFRLCKTCTKNLYQKIAPELNPKVKIRTVIPGEIKILCALRHFATGSLQKQTAQDLNFNLSQPSVSRCVVTVSKAICKYFMDTITFPDVSCLKNAFSDIGGFPGVIGIVGCTHIEITAPPENSNSPPNAYLNQNKRTSLNVLFICDAKMKIIYVNGKFPGASMDWFVWRHSKLYHILEEKLSKDKDSWLIDSKNCNIYVLSVKKGERKRKAHTLEEKTYNLSHERTWKTWEKCIYLLKSKFQCLRHKLHYSPETAECIIYACVILHNLCLQEDADIEDTILSENYSDWIKDKFVPVDSLTNTDAELKRNHQMKSELRSFPGLSSTIFIIDEKFQKEKQTSTSYLYH